MWGGGGGVREPLQFGTSMAFISSKDLFLGRCKGILSQKVKRKKKVKHHRIKMG